jgi:hypothetical protein
MHGERSLCASNRTAYSPLVEDARHTGAFSTMV